MDELPVQLVFDYSCFAPHTQAALRTHASEIQDHMNKTVEHLIEAGKRLSDAYAILAQTSGSFDAWVQYEFGISRTTAFRFIRVYQESLKRPVLGQLNVSMQVLYMLTAPTTPEEVKKEGFARIEQGESLSSDEVKTIIADHHERTAPELDLPKPEPRPCSDCAYFQGEPHYYFCALLGKTFDTPDAGQEEAGCQFTDDPIYEESPVFEVPAFVTPSDRVQFGEWWQLGPHQLYCGDTASEEFWSRLKPGVPLAVCHLPYDDPMQLRNPFRWGHDWLSELCSVVAVVPGLFALSDFAKLTTMPYHWTLCGEVLPEADTSAVGRGTWIAVLLYSRTGVYCGEGDRVAVVLREAELQTFREHAPFELVSQVLRYYTNPGDVVVDPFLDTGTTLFVAHRDERICVGGDLNPHKCAQILEIWERMTGIPACKGLL